MVSFRAQPTLVGERPSPWTVVPGHGPRPSALSNRAVAFRDPRVPIIASHASGLLETTDDMRGTVLAIVDEARASRATVAVILRADLDRSPAF